MKNIVGAFGTLLVIVINFYVCVTISGASAAVAAAKEFKAEIVAEIENSNFNEYVIAGCIEQANEAGYELRVTNYTYNQDEDIQTAEVILTYSYELPLFGISATKMTRGIAR